jgi:hypothetical protein
LLNVIWLTSAVLQVFVALVNFSDEDGTNWMLKNNYFGILNFNCLKFDFIFFITIIRQFYFR